MKKLVLLLMLFGALRSFGAVATNVQNLSQFGTTNRAMASDGIGLSTRYATGSERLMGIQVTNLIRSLNALGIGTNTVLISAGTNIIVVTNRTSSNVTYTISVATNAAGAGSSMTNALLHAGPTNGSVNALILTAGTNIILSTDGTNRVIATSNNVSLVDVTNIVNNATNGLAIVSPPISSVQYNSNGVQSGSSGFVFTNGLVGLGTNIPSYLLHLFNSDITKPSIEIGYASGAGTPGPQALQIRAGTGVTNVWFTTGGNGYLASSLAVGSNSILSGLYVDGAVYFPTVTGSGERLAWVDGAVVRTNATAGVDLGAVTNVVTNYVQSVIGNFMNLSVQAAKLPTTNFPTIDAGWQNWELIYYATNSDGFSNALEGYWQFIVPTNYFTNNMKVYGQNILLQTNGPSSTGLVWRASFLRATPGDSTDVHVGSFGTAVSVTQTWAASATGTNKVQDFLIDLSTNSLLMANDFAILKLERVNSAGNTNEFKGGTSLIGLQLRY